MIRQSVRCESFRLYYWLHQTKFVLFVL